MVGLVVLISQVALLLRLVTLVALAYMTCLPTLSTYMTYLADLSSLNLKKSSTYISTAETRSKVVRAAIGIRTRNTTYIQDNYKWKEDTMKI